MDWLQIIGLVAPAAVSILVQGIKKLMAVNGYVALAVVFVVSGLSAIAGIGPVVDATWADTAVNAGWITGVATFLFALFKPRTP